MKILLRFPLLLALILPTCIAAADSTPSIPLDWKFTSDANQYLAKLQEFDTRGNKFQAETRAGNQTSQASLDKLNKQRDRFFAQQVEQLGPIVFFTRHQLARPNAANCAIWQSVPERWGCSIRIYDPRRPKLAARTIFQDPAGSIYDMNL